MANVTITQLPQAGAITGQELVPVVQNGQTVQTTTAAISASPSQTQTFITINQEPTLAELALALRFDWCRAGGRWRSEQHRDHAKRRLRQS